jgi:hypothetical protein
MPEMGGRRSRGLQPSGHGVNRLSSRAKKPCSGLFRRAAGRCWTGGAGGVLLRRSSGIGLASSSSSATGGFTRVTSSKSSPGSGRSAGIAGGGSAPLAPCAIDGNDATGGSGIISGSRKGTGRVGASGSGAATATSKEGSEGEVGSSTAENMAELKISVHSSDSSSTGSSSVWRGAGMGLMSPWCI